MFTSVRKLEWINVIFDKSTQPLLKKSFTNFHWNTVEVRATGLRSFMHEMTGFLGTGIIQERFQMSGINCV